MKTIWIIDHYSSEPKYGGIARQYDFAVELSKRGYNVVVISSSFSHFSHSYISDQQMFVSKINDRAHFVYLRTSSYEVNSGLARFKNIYSFERAVNKHREKIAEMFGKPDTISGCSVHPLAWVAAFKASKRYKSRFVIEVRDFWPEIWIASGERSKLDPVVIYFALLEKWAYKKADKIIYSMQHGDNYISGKLGVDKNKLCLIGQPMDTKRFDIQAKENESLIPEQIRSFIESSFLCTFAGYYMEYEGVFVMLEAAKILQERNIPVKMLFVGSGKEQSLMEKYVVEHDLDNVMVSGRINKESIPALLKKSKVCLAHLAIKENNKAYQYGVSKNKVNEYLYSGACTIYGFHMKNDAVATSGAGYVIQPFNSIEFADKIEKVYLMSDEEYLKFGRNGRKYITENHRVEVLVDRLEQAFF